MIKTKHLFFLLSLCIATVNAGAQDTDLALGQWKSHLPFKNGLQVAQSSTQAYFSTEQAVLVVDKTDGSFERLTKVEGLSNVGVRTIAYNQGIETLVVVYNSGVIDLVNDEGIFTILNIPESQIILGEKIIYQVYMADDSTAYLASNFGLSRLNLRTGKFPATTKTPIPIKAATIYNNAIYAGTDEGIYTVSLDGSINVDDFNNWTFLGEEEGFPMDYSSESLTVFEGKLYMAVNDEIWSYDGASPVYVYDRDLNELTFITSEGTNLIAGFFRPDSTRGSRVIRMDALGAIQECPDLCAISPINAVEDAQGRVWMADASLVFHYWTPSNDACTNINVNAPRSKGAAAIAIANDEVWIASGGIDITNNTGLGFNEGMFSLIDNTWADYNKFNVFSGLGIWDDFNAVAIHPENGRIYGGSFTDGLAEFENQELIEIYDENNSTLRGDVDSQSEIRVAGLAFDEDNNLWISNHKSDVPLSVYRNDGTWKSFSFGCTSDNSSKNIIVDAFGYKWIALTNTSFGIVVFDEGDFNDDTDDRCKIITTSNSNLPTNEVRDMALDLDGNVWVGTKQGAIVFECSVLDSDCPGSLRIVEQDNFGAFLLEEEDVLTVAVDGANRKWFGTTNGIFVQSPSGEEQVARFTTENSLLFDNNIQDIAFNDVTGEVYIGTNEGLQVYRGQATAGGSVNSKITVFPNPVRPEYIGDIAIKGLAQDANVKITDVNGQLVFETTALGGQAIWNGLDYNGRKANTGVYLVFATSRNTANPDAAVAKILFIN